MSLRFRGRDNFRTERGLFCQDGASVENFPEFKSIFAHNLTIVLADNQKGEMVKAIKASTCDCVLNLSYTVRAKCE